MRSTSAREQSIGDIRLTFDGSESPESPAGVAASGMLCVTLVVSLLCTHVIAYIIEPGPAVIATKGAVWPQPKAQRTLATCLRITPTSFDFLSNVPHCSLLTKAFDRYWRIVNERGVGSVRAFRPDEDASKLTTTCHATLSTLKVYLKNNCTDDELPSDSMNESYYIQISGESSYIIATSIWGALRGLETFSQLIYFDVDESTLILNETKIADEPRFPFRGLMLDTSRHFIPKELLLRNLDAMAYNKFNVFHWHLTDDQSFPYESVALPELSRRGAYHPRALVYTPQDVADIVEEARRRGIRVLAEFDTPGHTRSWGAGAPGILTACYTPAGDKPDGTFGPLDPTVERTYNVVRTLFTEVRRLFPDAYLHLGGDEVEFECWRSNPAISAFMKAHGIAGDYEKLAALYEHRLLGIVRSLGAHAIVWEEAFANSASSLPNDTVVHVWRDDGKASLRAAIAAGHPALLSACWYLDHLADGGDWRKFYECDPHALVAGAPPDQVRRVRGGAACMWGESVDAHNLIARVWPRAAAAAEKLWSVRDADTPDAAARRLEEHTCRLIARGIHAQPPNGPGYCL